MHSDAPGEAIWIDAAEAACDHGGLGSNLGAQ